MPELPEVETVKAALDPVLTGHKIEHVTINRHDLRFPIPNDFTKRTEKQKITKTQRRGKYIIISLQSGEHMMLHLGMSGRISIFKKEEEYEEKKHDHVILDLTNQTKIIFNDPRRFGMLLLTDKGEDWIDHKLFKAMGPEPLNNEFNAPILQNSLKNKTTNIKTALLDQHVVCGIGNIYACEALFESGIAPDRKAGTLTIEEIEPLTAAIKAVLQRAIKAGGSSLKDYAHTDGSLGYFQTMFKVYDQEKNPCPTCKTPIERIVQSGRSTFYCASCQK